MPYEYTAEKSSNILPVKLNGKMEYVDTRKLPDSLYFEALSKGLSWIFCTSHITDYRDAILAAIDKP